MRTRQALVLVILGVTLVLQGGLKESHARDGNPGAGDPKDGSGGVIDMVDVNALWEGSDGSAATGAGGGFDAAGGNDKRAPVAGSISLKKKLVTASTVSKGLELRFPFANGMEDPVRVSYFVLVEDLAGNQVAHRGGKRKVAPGFNDLTVSLPKLLSGQGGAEEVDYVVSYSLKFAGKRANDRKSLFYLMPKPVLAAHVPENFYAGADARLPVKVMDAVTHQPYAWRTVRLTAKTEKGKKATVTARTDANGTALVKLPAFKKGRVELAAAGELAGGGVAEVSFSAEVIEETKILITTDKPLYQPGQTLHLRSLILKRPDNRPVGKEDVLMEIMDAKGNKVFKKATRTNAFGVASASFVLATQVNLGKYTVAVTAGDNQMEKAVTVERYVLPKFKVTSKLDREYYLPGQKLEGTVDARYFFGKPVSGAKVKVTVFDYQAQWVPDRVIQGTANSEGILHFSYKLPKRLIGQPLEGGDALMLMEVAVEDSAGQKHSSNKQIVVAREPMKVGLFPESGAIVPGVSNRFYLVVSDPAGGPMAAGCRLSSSIFGQKGMPLTPVKVGDNGIATFSLVPKNSSLDIQVAAKALSGHTHSASFHFDAAGADTSVLARTDRAIYKGGETMVVDVLAPGGVSDAFLDVTRDNQTVATATVAMENGKGSYKLDLDQGINGTLVVSAYVLSERGEFTRDSRVVYVESASDLKVDVASDRDQYKPAETALVEFQVTDGNDNPVQAALGIQVVDEAVFALSESKPGLLKLYFALEEELQKASYQIGPLMGQTLGSLIMRASAATDDGEKHAVQENAAVALAAHGDVAVRITTVSSWTGTREKTVARLNQHFAKMREEMAGELRKSYQCYNQSWQDLHKLYDEVLARQSNDPWGTKFRTKAEHGNLTLTSAGPDALFESWDDVTVTLNQWELCPRVETTAVRARRGGWDMDFAEGAVPMAAGDAGGMMKLAAEKPMDELREQDRADDGSKADGKAGGGEGGGEKVRVRSWFPETLFVEPSLITDENGRAAVEIPLADSITSWRMSTLASDMSGRLGGSADPMVVFQDFFVDIDFPVFLTRNDEVQFPIAIYNYLEEEQEITLEVQEEDWMELLGEGKKTLRLGPGEVAGASFPVRVKKVGWHSLTVHGRGSRGVADAIRRTVQVRSDGKEILSSASGKFSTEKDDGAAKDRVEVKLDYPKSTIDGSANLVVQVLPGLASHVVQGMDSMLRLPGG